MTTFAQHAEWFRQNWQDRNHATPQIRRSVRGWLRDDLEAMHQRNPYRGASDSELAGYADYFRRKFNKSAAERLASRQCQRELNRRATTILAYV
jgi:hypothetical protein